MNHHMSDEGGSKSDVGKQLHGCCTSGNKPSSGGGMSHSKWMMILCLLPLLIIGGAYLWSSGQNVQWTWLLILLCPLAHIFMMRGHGGHGGHSGGDDGSSQHGVNMNKEDNEGKHGCH